MATPSFTFAHQLLRGRTEDVEFFLYDADDSPLGLAVSDVVRFKLGTSEVATPALDLDSVAATTNGSVVTVNTIGSAGVTPAKVTVRFAQADTATLSGKYYGELDVVDDSETSPANAIKPAGQGTITFAGSMGGDIGLT